MKAMKMKLITLISILAISGCSNSIQNHKNNHVQNKGKTMKQIMQEQGMDGNDHSNNVHVYKPSNRSSNKFNYMSYTRTAKTELDGLFPSLPNPSLCPYITPHMNVEGGTVPGYTSCFRMYEKNHYALPGEANAIWQ